MNTRRIWLYALAGTLAAWNAAAEANARQVQSDTSSKKASQEAQGSREQSNKKEAGAQASGSGSASASTSAEAGRQAANLSSGTTMEAELLTGVDARKNHVGDRVVARTTKDVKANGQVVMAKGSKLMGHVSEAKARTKGESQSALGIVFDRAILKNGQEMPLHVTIQALAAAQSAASGSLGDDDAMASAGGMGSATASGREPGSGRMARGVTSAAGGATGTVTNTAGAAGSTVGHTVGAATNTTGSASGALSASSTGVIGLQGLTLNTEASSSTQGSLIVSSSRNVHLDGGTQMVLRVQGEAH